MILIDVNLLIYAYDDSSEFHDHSRAWLEDAFSEVVPVKLAWSTIHAFLRLSTHPSVHLHPLAMREAVQIVETWLARPTVGILEPGTAYWMILSRILNETQVRGALVSDAHLAALAIEHGAVLHSADRDFRRFNGLQFVNPLARTS